MNRVEVSEEFWVAFQFYKNRYKTFVELSREIGVEEKWLVLLDRGKIRFLEVGEYMRVKEYVERMQVNFKQGKEC